MEFRLFYRGPLKSGTSANRKDKQKLRRYFHDQLKVLWSQPYMKDCRPFIDCNRTFQEGDICLLSSVGSFDFASLISSAKGWYATAELDILFLRTANSGDLVVGGDIDNRLKTLLDSLRVPKVPELPEDDSPSNDEKPFHCLLEDDALITALSIRADRLLVPNGNRDVELILHVKTKVTRKTMGNDVVW